jgi:hypothetical protein
MVPGSIDKNPSFLSILHFICPFSRKIFCEETIWNGANGPQGPRGRRLTKKPEIKNLVTLSF